MPVAVRLNQPVSTGSMSVEEAIRRRRSSRDYSGRAITVDDVSPLLWAAQGVTGNMGQRATPSAGGQYPLCLYFVAGIVTGLPLGLYEYEGEGHVLKRLSNEDLRSALGDAAIGDQPWVRDAAGIIVVAADIERMTEHFEAQPPRGERGARYAYIEIGALAENVILQATALDVGTVLVGGFIEDPVKTALGLPSSLEPTALLCIGQQ